MEFRAASDCKELKPPPPRETIRDLKIAALAWFLHLTDAKLMPSQEFNRLDPAAASVPSLWAALTRIFRRKPAAGPSMAAIPIPLLEPLPSAPEILLSPVVKQKQGEGAQLRRASNPEAASGQPSQKVLMGEMPTPSSVVPVIIMQLATTSVQVPPAQVAATDSVECKASANTRDLNLAPCTRGKDLPVA